MAKMQRTNLVWDEYIDYLIDAINESKFMKRAEDKPMATPKTAEEVHVTTRAIHLRESADIAKRIAKGLGLNAEYIYAAMLGHDAGHPFSAHEGEEIFNHLGEIYNIQYFHHNAKGIGIFISEDICGKAISKIPNIENKPELKKQLEDEFVYFLDVIISHDGEATKEDMMKPETPYTDLKEALEAKMRLANSENKYKFIAQTPEGKIAKFADVIAYLSSDMQDGFRLGIIKGFSDEYLELFGEMFSTEYPITREDKIDCGRRIIEHMKEQNLREKRESIDFMEGQDVDIQNALKTINKKIQQANLNIHNKDELEQIQQIIEEEKAIFRGVKIDKFFIAKGLSIPEEERESLEERIAQKTEQGKTLDGIETEFARTLNKINSDANKVEEFAVKMLRARSSVVYELTSRMKEFFINDLLKNSQNQETPQFSNAAWDFFFRAKNLNYKEYVQYTNWDYQTEVFPETAMQLAEKCANGLVKSGAIRNKFYDDAVRVHIKDEEALKHMETAYRPEKTYTSYRKRNGIGDLTGFMKPLGIVLSGNKNNREAMTPYAKRDFKKVAKSLKGGFTGTKKQHALMKLIHDTYSYVQNEDELFAIKYVNTFNAVKQRVRRKIEKALGEKPEVSEKHLYKEMLQTQIDEIRQDVQGLYGTIDLTPEQKEEYIGQKIQEELGIMEQKMAMQLATDYLAGMSDRTFIQVATKTGVLNPEVVRRGERGIIPSENVQQLMTKLDAEQKATKPTAPIGTGYGR